MHTFTPGALARAEHVNENFTELLNKITALEQVVNHVNDGKTLINGQLYNFTGVIRNFPRPRLELRNGHYAATINVKHPFAPPSGYKFTYTVEESSGFTFVSRGSETLTETTLRIFQVANGDNNALTALRYWLVKA